MRKLVMYCDRCKKEFEKWTHKKDELYGVAEFVYGDEIYLDDPKDLCESCYTELENWWNFIPVIKDTPTMNESDRETRRKGKWIRIANGATEEKYMCSVCHRIIEDSNDYFLIPKKYPYCHCGAKMEAEEHE